MATKSKQKCANRDSNPDLKQPGERLGSFNSTLELSAQFYKDFYLFNYIKKSRKMTVCVKKAEDLGGDDGTNRRNQPSQ